MREQRVILKEQADAPFARGDIDALLRIKKHAPVQHDASAVGRLQAGNRAQRHRLARTGRPEQSERRTVRREFHGQPEPAHIFFNRNFQRHARI